MPVIVKHGGNDAGGTVGRSGYDAPASGILLRDGQGEEIHPCGVGRLEHGVFAPAVAAQHIGIRGETPIHFRRAAGYVKATGQCGFRRGASVVHTGAHNTPDGINIGSDLDARA